MDSHNWTLLKLYMFNQNEPRLMEYLQQKGLIKARLKCPRCDCDMNLDPYDQSWICQKSNSTNRRKRRCDEKISIRQDTLFSRSSLPIVTTLELIYLIIHSWSLEDILYELSSVVNQETVTNWTEFVRHVMEEWSSKNSEVSRPFVPNYCKRKREYSGGLAHFLFVKYAEMNGIDLLESFMSEVSQMDFTQDQNTLV